MIIFCTCCGNKLDALAHANECYRLSNGRRARLNRRALSGAYLPPFSCGPQHHRGGRHTRNRDTRMFFIFFHDPSSTVRSDHFTWRVCYEPKIRKHRAVWFFTTTLSPGAPIQNTSTVRRSKNDYYTFTFSIYRYGIHIF